MSKVLEEAIREVCAKHGQQDELPKLLINWIGRVEEGLASAEDPKEGITLATLLIEKAKAL